MKDKKYFKILKNYQIVLWPIFSWDKEGITFYFPFFWFFRVFPYSKVYSCSSCIGYIEIRKRIKEKLSLNKQIVRNQAKCKLCGDLIESKHVHDFVECSCGEIFVDGGGDYFRRGWKTSQDNFIPIR